MNTDIEIGVRLTATRLREVMHYDEETGVLTRLVCFQRPDLIGQVSESTHGNGYLRAVIDGRRYYAHRLVWLWMTGEWPSGEIDHINGDRTDNRWQNLRDTTRRQNSQNLRLAKSNTSGVLGVSWDSARGKWTARIRVADGPYKYLGRFDEIQQASEAYLAAKRLLHEGCTI